MRSRRGVKQGQDHGYARWDTFWHSKWNMKNQKAAMGGVAQNQTGPGLVSFLTQPGLKSLF